MDKIMIKKKEKLIAYFSMEIAVDEKLNNYAGGLGILAGDLIRSAADQKIPMVGVSLLNRFGYFKQIIRQGKQNEQYKENDLSILKKINKKIKIKIGSDEVLVGAWRYFVKGFSGFKIPVYFLDTNFPENKKKYRQLCHYLYEANHNIRLQQEIILGRGGVRFLEALKINPDKYHINEGHGAFAFVELFLKNPEIKLKELKKQCIFTTHSPIKAANDIFSVSEVKKNFLDFPFFLQEILDHGSLNMGKMAMHFSGFINGVSKKHAVVSRKIFFEPRIKAISNGINLNFWVFSSFKKIYNQEFSGWETNNKLLTKKTLNEDEVWRAHQKAKKKMLEMILRESGEFLPQDFFTIVIARRFVAYKRLDLIFKDLRRLLKIHKKNGPIQIVFAGKAHPKDSIGKETIARVLAISKKYRNEIKIVFLENYNIPIAKLLVSGADLWLNNPLPPNEASATSGMKAAANGVPQLSTLDGWWPEGYLMGKTGWTIKSPKNLSDHKSLLDNLEREILPIFYHDQKRWRKIMANTIKNNAYKFSSERMITEYKKLAYEK